MSQFRHNICEQCWRTLHPAMIPVHHPYPKTAVCSFCGDKNIDGIYLLHDGDLLPCGGSCSTTAHLQTRLTVGDEGRETYLDDWVGKYRPVAN